MNLTAQRRRAERVFSTPSSVLKSSLSLSELSSCLTGRWALARGIGMRLIGLPGKMLKLILLP